MNFEITILSLESTCDESSAGIVSLIGDQLTVQANVVRSQVDVHKKFGGVVPNLAAREHIRNLPVVVEQAFETANISPQQIDALAIANGPGLIPALLSGVGFAKALAYAYHKPLLATNHMEGHVYSNWLPQQVDEGVRGYALDDIDIFPAICLVVSGGHSQLILVKDHGHYELLGQTLDDAAGEAFDKIARVLELPYPGGPEISKQALLYDASTKKIDLTFPRPMLHDDNYNFSFSGLKTSVLYKVRDLIADTHDLKDLTPQLAYEAQRAIIDVLIAKTKKAAERFDARSLMLCGGVSANKPLRAAMETLGNDFGIKVFVPPFPYTTDNGAMIGAAALATLYRKGVTREDLKQMDVLDSIEKVQADANWEIV